MQFNISLKQQQWQQKTVNMAKSQDNKIQKGFSNGIIVHKNVFFQKFFKILCFIWFAYFFKSGRKVSQILFF